MSDRLIDPEKTDRFGRLKHKKSKKEDEKGEDGKKVLREIIGDAGEVFPRDFNRTYMSMTSKIAWRRFVDTDALKEIEESLRLDGHSPGTESYERELTIRKARKCRELRGELDCRSCGHFVFCDVGKNALRLRVEKQE